MFYCFVLGIYAFVALLLLLIGILISRMLHWFRYMVPHDPPAFLLGNLRSFSITRKLSEALRDTYNRYKHSGVPFCGFYLLFQPIALVTDLNLARNVLIRDVHNFDDRGLFHNKRDDPLSDNLLTVEPAEWRELRLKLLPIFTSGKMQLIYPTVFRASEKLTQALAELQSVYAEQDMYELLRRYTIDVLANCIFGVESNSLKQPHNAFSLLIRRLTTSSRHSDLVNTLILCFPKLAQWWRMRVTLDDVRDFYLRLVRETIAKREAKNIKSVHLMDILIKLKNAEQEQNRLSITEITANAALFFKIGYETTSATIIFALYELAVNQDAQTKLRMEILAVLNKHNGKLSYESLLKIKYLDMVIAETLRMHPIYPYLERVANEDYKTTTPGLIINSGTKLFIPIEAMQNDPEIFAEPTKFIPERFAVENLQRRQLLAWMPFGEGPRNCIGMRFSQLLVRISLVSLLSKYKFTPTSHTPIPLAYEETSLVLRPKGGVYMRADRL